MYVDGVLASHNFIDGRTPPSSYRFSSPSYKRKKGELKENNVYLNYSEFARFDARWIGYFHRFHDMVTNLQGRFERERVVGGTIALWDGKFRFQSLLRPREFTKFCLYKTRLIMLNHLKQK